MNVSTIIEKQLDDLHSAYTNGNYEEIITINMISELFFLYRFSHSLLLTCTHDGVLNSLRRTFSLED
jgi:hypothetical protein